MPDPIATTGFGGSDWSPVTSTYRELAGRVAIVTGAARGLGAMYAQGLAEAGVRVHACDIDGEAMNATAKRLNAALPSHAGEVVAGQVDVVASQSVQSFVASVADQEGRLDVMVNNAGIFPTAPFLDITPEQLARTFGVNVNGTVYGSQAAAAVMRQQGHGSIINMGSVAANRVRVDHADYCAAKAAVEHLTRSLAVELGPYGIRVNGIGPGDIDTDMLRDLHDSPEALTNVLRNIPLGRIGSPWEVLALLLFLVSDGSRYVTGHTIAVDGGSRLVR